MGKAARARATATKGVVLFTLKELSLCCENLQAARQPYATTKRWSCPSTRSRMSKLEKLSFNDVLKWHALAAGPAGLVLVALPHRLFAQLSGAPYSPAAHEVARCYGALTAAQAWFAWRTRRIADGRVRRMLAEAYALCYALTGLALGRAMAAAPVGALGALACFASWALALLYAYFRVVRRIKSFELPGSAADGHDL